jgi:transcriptional regulator with XRE-family HTH domain
MITPLQVKMARAALGWGVRDLAKKADLTANTISKFENGSDVMVGTLTKMQNALEEAGVIFLPADEAGGPGVRLRTAGTD